MIQTVKYTAEIESPTLNTGYLVNNELNVPMDPENGHYQLVQDWIDDGNTPEPAYTQAQLDIYEVRRIKREQEDLMKGGQLVGVDNNSREDVGAESGITDIEAYEQWMLDLYTAYDNNDMVVPVPPAEIIDRLEMFGVTYNGKG